MVAEMTLRIILHKMMLTMALLGEQTPLLTGKWAQTRTPSNTTKEGAGTWKRRGKSLVIVRNSIVLNDPTTRRTQGVEIEGDGGMVEAHGPSSLLLLTCPFLQKPRHNG